MIFIEDAFRLDQIDIVLARGVPRQFQYGFDICSADRRFRGRRLHLGESADFLFDLGCDLLVKIQFRQFFFESGDLILQLLNAAQFLLDGAQLLAQVVFALVLVDLALDLCGDILLNRQNLDFLQQDVVEFPEPLLLVQCLEDRLLVLNLDFQMRRDHIRHPARRFDCHDRRKNLRRQTLVDVDVVIKAAQHGPHQSFCFRVGFFIGVFQLPDPAFEIRHLEEHFFDAASAESFHQYANGISRQLEHLLDLADGSDFIEIVRCR